jgi:hypothetical protein
MEFFRPVKQRWDGIADSMAARRDRQAGRATPSEWFDSKCVITQVRQRMIVKDWQNRIAKRQADLGDRGLQSPRFAGHSVCLGGSPEFSVTLACERPIE